MEINWNKWPSNLHLHENIIKETENLWKIFKINRSDKWSDNSTVITNLTMWDNIFIYEDILKWKHAVANRGNIIHLKKGQGRQRYNCRTTGLQKYIMNSQQNCVHILPFVVALFWMQPEYPILTVILVIITTISQLNCPDSKYKFPVTK